MRASKAQFKRFFKSFVEMMKREKRYTWILIVSVLFLLLTLALPLWKIYPDAFLNPFIPLHYNVLFGIDRFGPWYNIFWIPAFGLLALVSNVLVGTLVYHQEKFMTTLLIAGTLGVQMTLFSSMVLIVLVNL